MRNYKIHLIRHGLTSANLEGRYIGRTDLPLCGQAYQDFDYLLENCHYPNVSKVYSSPLLRCMDTAGYIYPEAEIEAVNELIEMDMGEFEGLSADELQKDERFLAWMKDAVNNPPPGGEDTEGFMLRLIGAFNGIIKDMMETGIYDAAIVTHGGVIMTLLSAIGLPKAPMSEWQMPSGCGFTVQTSSQMWMRDRAVEVTGYLPQGLEKLLRERELQNREEEEG